MSGLPVQFVSTVLRNVIMEYVPIGKSVGMADPLGPDDTVWLGVGSIPLVDDDLGEDEGDVSGLDVCVPRVSLFLLVRQHIRMTIGG